ncbi:endonuclease domain-containing protein [uncultured Sphingomonas sp.]|uniref:endonuclease domain-containing protein n=1 Tax=uncultured Sphingomonas sp. TaxID=158754 RepID=UPI0035CBD09B
MPKVEERLLDFAKALRKQMTPAEARLWYHLRAKRLNGIKVVRQSVRRPYIADFVARSHKLIIEIDGDTHARSESYDVRRTVRLERDGYRVMRFTNADVMGNEDGVLTSIIAALSSSPSPRPSPQRGEGEEERAHLAQPFLREQEGGEELNSLSPLGRGPGRGVVPQ